MYEKRYDLPLININGMMMNYIKNSNRYKINGRRQYVGNLIPKSKNRISRSYGYNVVERDWNNPLLTPFISENEIGYDNNDIMEGEDNKTNETPLVEGIYDENSEDDVETSSDMMFNEDVEQDDVEDDDVNDNLNAKDDYLKVEEAEIQEFNFKALIEQLLSNESDNENDIFEERYSLPQNPEISL